MLYTVSEVSEKVNLSKVSIYKRLKLKDMQGHITKESGVTYIDEVGLKLIQESLKSTEDIKTDINYKELDDELNDDVSTDVDVLTLNSELVNALIGQLKAKDIQIAELNNRLAAEQDLHKNTQVLLRSEQEKIKQENLFALEEHFKEVDNKLMQVKEELNQRRQHEGSGIFKRLFKKY